MSQNYDNWERTVEIVVRRDELRQVALYSSREPSFSSISSSFISEQATPIHDDQNIQLRSSSNTVNETDWDGFLPSDYEDIIARSVNPVAYATKKDLYLSLCDSPILLDGGNTKRYMIGARELEIFWAGDPEVWEWTSHKDSRFSMVVELLWEWGLDIRGRIETQMLSPKTHYAAYLVFKLGKHFRGFESEKGIIKFVKYDKDYEAERRATTLHLQPVKSRNGKIAVRRSDGWMEVQLGMFYNDLGDDGPVEAWFLGNNDYIKSGLIVEGIEFQPTTNADIEINRRKGIFSKLRIFG
ncbi:putative F-box protein PP2-B8 [Abeliophyllum distichum]|uniref:F-box protein PP2-B8 n=1 Tax=Abeliophyllum distichum TaxID=126358 RepID=A0ABD1Q027_9LAMI